MERQWAVGAEVDDAPPPEECLRDSQCFDKPELDGAASLIIGLLLAGVAVALVLESRGLLIGEGIRPETARAIRSIALDQPKVRDVGRVLSMYIGPDDVLVTMDLDFDDGTAAVDAAAAIAAVERRVRDRYPMIKRLFIEAGAAPPQQRWSSAGFDASPSGSAIGRSQIVLALFPHESPRRVFSCYFHLSALAELCAMYAVLQIDR
jgi:hypothetical protein